MKTTSNNINDTKYFFIGFIVGIIPFSIILSIIHLFSKELTIFTITLAIASIITSLTNGFIFKNIALKKFISKI